MITSFSQGGSPPSGGAFGGSAPVPITAGSSDGMVMLFFDEIKDDVHPANGNRARSQQSAQSHEDKLLEYSLVKVITTISNGVHGKLPHPEAQPKSYAFSLAGNRRLPLECSPTLAIHYDTPSECELLSGDLLICRLEDGYWKEQPTYVPAGATVAAAPLTLATVPDLFAATPSTQYYQLFWIPRNR